MKCACQILSQFNFESQFLTFGRRPLEVVAVVGDHERPDYNVIERNETEFGRSKVKQDE